MKTVIIGAAKPGYSEAITRLCIEKGMSIIGTYSKEYSKEAEALKSEFSNDVLELHEVELSDRNSLSTFCSSIKNRINGFVFAQFFFEMENPFQFDHDLWDKSIAINLTAPNFLIHELKSKMVEESSIVIITSSEGMRGSYGASSYAATKAAIHNLVKSFANTLGNQKIRINALPAGWIGGEMDTDEVFNKSRSLTPLGRLGSDIEVANVVIFLLSNQSSFVNGTTIVVDGGYLCSDPLSKYEFDDTYNEQ